MAQYRSEGLAAYWKIRFCSGLKLVDLKYSDIYRVCRIFCIRIIVSQLEKMEENEFQFAINNLYSDIHRYFYKWALHILYCDGILILNFAVIDYYIRKFDLFEEFQ